jgi:hypothetical protein
MIGVIADPTEHDVVREFFELFKTPWEFHRPGRRYEVLLCTTERDVGGGNAGLTLAYGASRTPADDDAGVGVTSGTSGTVLLYGRDRIPIYGRSVSFDRDGSGLVVEASGRSAGYVTLAGDQPVVRIGYDLFREARTVLADGQPHAHAGIPTLDLHISLLRDLIIANGASLVEIPPTPSDHPLIACLTHDVDHPSIRRHSWDHTTFGFLYRACVGSAVDLCRGRRSFRDVLTNWGAAVGLPFVHLGLVRDYWEPLDRYLKIDPPGSSTYFVVPFKDHPGRTIDGEAPAFRAARYGARDIADRVRRLVAAGCEVGLHGLDAWLDSAKGYEELTEVERITGAGDTGVRMHWLYGDAKAAPILEKAGFAYDATAGYNETVGYRAGTTQVFKPLDAMRLLELPLHVMDTALFYRTHLDLSFAEAEDTLRRIIAHAIRVGGVLAVNWHDRSLAPERLWGPPYARLVEQLKRAGAWFATASRAVAWFRQRRSVAFDTVTWEPGSVRVRLKFESGEGLPGLRLRVHPGRRPPMSKLRDRSASHQYFEVPVRDAGEVCVRLAS